MPADKTTAAAPTPAPATQFEAIVEQWVSDHLRDSALARNTEAWNVFQTARPALIAALTATANKGA